MQLTQVVRGSAKSVVLAGRLVYNITWIMLHPVLRCTRLIRLPLRLPLALALLLLALLNGRRVNPAK